MSIQLSSESLLSLSEAAAILPGRPHLSTLHRWRLRGVRGIQLETCLIGGTRYTSKEALQEFIEATTRATRARTAPIDAPIRAHLPANVRRHQRATQATAGRVLDAAGI